jgi:hypothetical protein
MDWGLLTLGFQPALEGGNDIIDLIDMKADGEISIDDNFGGTKTIQTSDKLEAILALQTVMDFANLGGINEADAFNALRKVYKEQLKAASSTNTPNSPNSTRRRRPVFRRNSRGLSGRP